MIGYDWILNSAMLRNLHLPKLQTLRLGPLDRVEMILECKINLASHLSLVRRLSFQSYPHWKYCKHGHILTIELLKFAENVEEFDISSTEDYSPLIKGLIVSDGNDIILPKLKLISIHFENAKCLYPLYKFSLETFREMVGSRWRPQRTSTRLQEIRVFLAQSNITKGPARNLREHLEHQLAGYVSEGLILNISISHVGEVHWRDRLPHDENYWKEGMLHNRTFLSSTERF